MNFPNLCIPEVASQINGVDTQQVLGCAYSNIVEGRKKTVDKELNVLNLSKPISGNFGITLEDCALLSFYEHFLLAYCTVAV